MHGLVNHRFGTKPKKPDEGEQELAEELADVLFVILCMANEQGIDLDQAFDGVDGEVSHPGREALGEEGGVELPLASRRERPFPF